MGRRVMAVLAAVLVGLIGVGAVMVYASGADSRAVAAQHPQTVLIATALVPAGTSAADAVAKGLIVPTQVAAKAVPLGALHAVDAATGKLVALSDIAPGEFIAAARFGTVSLSQGAIQVPDGTFAISLTLSDSARVGAFMTPGSHIVLYDTYAPPSSATKSTRVLLDDVLVIAMGSATLKPAPAATDGAPAAVAGPLMTVALPPEKAATLVHVIQTGGSLYAGLRGANAKANLSQIVTDAKVFNR